MTRKELVVSALQHKETTPIPFGCQFTQQELNRMVDHTQNENFLSIVGECITGYMYSGNPIELKEKPGYFKDDFSVIWNRTAADKDIGVIDKPVIEDIANHNYRFPKVDAAHIRKNMEQLVQNKMDKFIYAGIGFSMFERAWSLCSIENLLVAMILEEEAVEALLAAICQYDLDVLEIMLEYEIDGVYFGDDWGQQKGLIMGPEHWRRFIKPNMKKLYDRAHQSGKFVLQHSCGDISEIYEDLIEIGLNAHQTFQPEIYDIKQFKDEFGDRLTVWGGISTQQVLPFKTPEEVKQECVRIMRSLGKNGGLIVAPTHDVPFDVPPENILAMLEVFQNQEKYL